MEFHGIPIPRWEVPWNSMKLRKFHGRWSDTKFHGTLGPPNGLSPSSIEFHEIPWNCGAAKCNITQFHGIPWNFEIVILINTMLSWTSMGYTMEFRGTLEWPIKKSPSSMGFHGITRAPLQMTQVFHGIPWNIPVLILALCKAQKDGQDEPRGNGNQSEFHGTLKVPWNLMPTPNSTEVCSSKHTTSLRLCSLECPRMASRTNVLFGMRNWSKRTGFRERGRNISSFYFAHL